MIREMRTDFSRTVWMQFPNQRNENPRRGKAAHAGSASETRGAGQRGARRGPCSPDGLLFILYIILVHMLYDILYETPSFVDIWLYGSQMLFVHHIDIDCFPNIFDYIFIFLPYDFYKILLLFL
jgi:hypothetical protein